MSFLKYYEIWNFSWFHYILQIVKYEYTLRHYSLTNSLKYEISYKFRALFKMMKLWVPLLNRKPQVQMLVIWLLRVHNTRVKSLYSIPKIHILTITIMVVFHARNCLREILLKLYTTLLNWRFYNSCNDSFTRIVH